jgi:hypothetical protein
VTGCGDKSIRDFWASLDFLFGVLGEGSLGPNLFLGDDGMVVNEIIGDTDRKRRVDVVAVIGVVVFTVSSSSKLIRGDDDRGRLGTVVTIILFVRITVSSSSMRIKGDGVLRLCASSLSSITLFVDLFREIVVSMSFLDEDTIFDNN